MNQDEFKVFSLFSKIDGMSNQFTKTDWRIVKFLKEHTKDFVKMNAQEIASRIKTSDASVIRFAQKIGYSGLNELKYAIQQNLDQNITDKQKSSYSILLDDTITLIKNLFQMTTSITISEVCQDIMKAGQIYIVGLDFNRSIADMIAHKYLLLGLSISSITTYDMAKLHSLTADSEKLFIFLSYSGNNKSISEIMSETKKNKSRNILVSNYEKSLCSSFSDLTMLIPKTDLLQSCNSMSREIPVLILFDLIFQNILIENSKAYDSFLKTSVYANEEELHKLTLVDKLKNYL